MLPQRALAFPRGRCAGVDHLVPGAFKFMALDGHGVSAASDLLRAAYR
jgi:hypothetical protein